MGTTVNTIKPKANLLLNGDMPIWQRGTSVNNNTSGKIYTADRWYCFTNAGSPTPSVTVARSTDVPTGFRFSMKAQRNSTNTNTSGLFLRQPIESDQIIPYQGKLMTFSFWAKAGANYSPTSSVLNVAVRTGTGIDEDSASGYTGSNAIVDDVARTLTTSWQRFNVSFTMPTNATEMFVGFRCNHTGTAGADDSFYITGLMLNEGGMPSVFARACATIAEEVQACQRYFYSVTTGGTTIILVMGSAINAGGWFGGPLFFPNTMRVSPTLAFASGTTSANFNLSDGINSALGISSGPSIGNAGNDKTPNFVNLGVATSGATAFRPYALTMTNGSLHFNAEL